MVWVDRQGREEPMAMPPPRAYGIPRISPDGTQVAVDIRDGENDIWIWDLARQTLRRLTIDPSLDQYPVWTPDGRRVVFASNRAGIPNLFWQPADGTGTVERLTTGPNQQLPHSFTPDGKSLILRETTPGTNTDLNLLRLANRARTEPLVHTTSGEQNGEISPDGRWLAYQSNESGRNEIYVRPFPNVEGGHWQVSSGGGTRPGWAPNGGELFFQDTTGALTSVLVQTGTTFNLGNPKRVFETRPLVAAVTGRTYDISRDGQRFLMIKDNTGVEQSSTPASLVVVINWVEELKARLPAR
jgi:serine/threonine-protein kinase